MDRPRIHLVCLARLAHTSNPEIDDFNEQIRIIVALLDLIAEKHVFQLEVAVNNSPAVAVVDSVDNLHYDFSGLHLRQLTFLLKILQDFAATRDVHNHNELFVLKKGRV